MKKYPIKKFDKDFSIKNLEYSTKGSREKQFAQDKSGRWAFLKYADPNYRSSELCSEKMAYELALQLGFDCARIELARGSNEKDAILNYLFTSIEQPSHADIVDFLSATGKRRQEFYSLKNIETTLAKLNPNLLEGFIRIMVFDALVGEQDRHEENWGITKHEDGSLSISPLYDNSDCLLREFYNHTIAAPYYNGIKDFSAYIKRSKSFIYDEQGKKYSHFALINILLDRYPELTRTYLDVVSDLKDDTISKIVDKIPTGMLDKQHRCFIKEYLIQRRNILANLKKRDKI